MEAGVIGPGYNEINSIHGLRPNQSGTAK